MLVRSHVGSAPPAEPCHLLLATSTRRCPQRGPIPCPAPLSIPRARSCSGAQRQQPPPPPRVTLGFSASVAPVPRSPAGFLVLLLN